MPFLKNPTSANLENLRAEGVSVQELRPVSFWLNRWAVRVVMLKDMDKLAFKRLAEHYLEREYEASEFEWFRSKSGSERMAFCHFKTFAL